MVDTTPQMLFGAASFYDGDTPINVGDSSLFDELDGITTAEQARQFAEKWHFGLFLDDATDLQSVRDTMLTAARWKALADEPETPTEAFADAGIRWFLDPLEDRTGAYLYSKYCIGIPINGYAVYLLYAIERYNNGTFSAANSWVEANGSITGYKTEQGRWELEFTDSTALLTGSAVPVIVPDDETAQKRAAALGCLDELASLHLLTVETRMVGGKVVQDTTNPISALWLSMGHAMNGTRATVCKACGRPMLVSGERGKPREYCGETCRQFRHRNKNNDKMRQSTAVFR